MADSKIKIGEPATDAAVKDAIHVPVASVLAGERLEPGTQVRIEIGYGNHNPGTAYTAHGGDAVGVVDPWLPRPINKGEYFWCLVRPGTIDDLCHSWKHKSFPDYETTLGEGYDECRGCY